MVYTITCRAKTAPKCLDGRPTYDQFLDPDEDLPMSEDGTWNGFSIVCDPCYIALMPLTPSGVALSYELDDAIREARKEKDG